MPITHGKPAIAVARSNNAKIGDAAVTYAAQGSCPSSCVFKDGGGCYAENGRLFAGVTQKLNASAEGMTSEEIAAAEAKEIDGMEVVRGRPMRLHTVGDCSTDVAALIVSSAAHRYVMRGGGPVWTYTHAWRSVKRRSWRDVNVFASCETPEDVADARARGYAAAIVVPEFPSERAFAMDGAMVVPCPAQTRHRSCTECRLCMDDQARFNDGVTIGFEVHGTGYTIKKATQALLTPDDPDRRLSLREIIPRLLVEEPDITNVEIARRAGVHKSSVWQMRRRLVEEGVI